MNIIRLRIEKALRIRHATSIGHQKTAQRRRGSYRKGAIALPHAIGMRLSEAQKQSLDALCARLNVERGLVLRDAIDFYLGLAEQEFRDDAPPVPTGLRRAAA